MITFILYELVRVFSLFIICFVVVMSSISVLQMILALFVIPGYIKKTRRCEYRLMGASRNMAPISVLIPAFNEEAAIVECIKSMLNSNYTNFEVLVINDGSKDKTLDTILGAFSLHKITYPARERLATKEVRGIYYNPDFPRLRLIDKEHGGKSDALNAGINLSRCPYFVTVDADCLLEEDALLRLAMGFMQNKYTIAAGGMIRLVNGCSTLNGKVTEKALPQTIWPLFQTVEYFRSFLVGRIWWNSLNSLLTLSGAFAAFQKEPVIQAGGYTPGSIGEDMDVVVKLHRYMRSKQFKYRVAFLPDPVCWTRAPESLDQLYYQRRRWQMGLIEVLARYRKMLFNPQYGLVGMLAMPCHVLFEMASPAVELLGYVMVPLAWYFGFVSLNALILFFTASVGFGVIVSLGSLLAEDFTKSNGIKAPEGFRLALAGIAENFFFRQITVFFRLRGILSYRKYKSDWGLSKRRRFNQSGQTVQPGVVTS
ncbi:MAG: glycosyltransferase family 2 protein [Treponema sp.]|nr:glycosyltransferase family 2 protein [Treponema sp.]